MKWDREEVSKRIRRAAERVARRFWWVEVEDAAQEGHRIVLEGDAVARATSWGAFERFLTDDLMDLQKTEAKWRNERIVPLPVADVSNEGEVLLFDGENKVKWDRIGSVMDPRTRLRGTTDPDYDNEVAAYVAPANEDRSHLLDRLASMSKDDFYEWGKAELGGAWGKKRDLHTLLYGYEDELEALWLRYARGKRIAGLSETDMESHEQIREAWRAFTRVRGDPRSVVLVGQRPLRDRAAEWRQKVAEVGSVGK